MSVYRTILERRTIRRFEEDKPLSMEVLEKMINAARLAPSAANLQPWKFVVINKKELCDKIFPYLRWAGYIAPKGDPPPGERPSAYIILIADPRINKSWQHDFGAAAQNIMLTAWEMGIGSCWIGSINRKKIKELLGIPQEYEVDTVIALGYPKEKPVIEEAIDSIKYWKDEKGVLHVPKRKLQDLLHINGW